MRKMTSSLSTSRDISAAIISLERFALERWNHGDPSGPIELSAEDVVYFDPFTEQRLDGLEMLKKHYYPINGQIYIPKYEMHNPKVKPNLK